MGVHISVNRKSPIYLGIGGSTHDFSACLLKDGIITNAIESERVSRIKHSLWTYSPINSALKYLIPQGGIAVQSISSSDVLYKYDWRGVNEKVMYYNHHLCHAASTFYTSPFTRAAVFVCDGMGSVKKTRNGYAYETYSYYLGEDTSLRLLGGNIGYVGDDMDELPADYIDVSNSVGFFYLVITKLIGFNFLDDGKTMGLSALGDSARFYPYMREYFDFKPMGKIDIRFGLKESQEFYHKFNTHITAGAIGKFHADIAAAAQKILEECYIYCLNYLYKITKTENLCLSGGVALNSVANGKIVQQTPFRHVHFFPACGDACIAVGAAYISYYRTHRKRVIIHNQTPFLGKTYDDKRIRSALRVRGVFYTKARNVYEETAALLAADNIVAWFQGGSEIGPRALGHRSIIVDPRKKWMKDYLNSRVKKRESFRPFAPAVLEAHVNAYFTNAHRSPYMLEVFPVKEDKRHVIPAVVHADGTGRVQTVSPDNKEFYTLIRAFYKLTGVPVILNTSFNINKMPIVETPEDAINCFLRTNIDVLVIGSYICTKPRTFVNNARWYKFFLWVKPYLITIRNNVTVVRWANFTKALFG